MNFPTDLLTVFPPSNQLLLDVTRRQIDDGMLEEIAEADYGIHAEQHLAALRPIRAQGAIPTTMGWHPGEVLELIRWSNPEDPAHKPGSPGRRGHQMRAFACAVLLRAAAEEGGGDSDEATLAQCLASAKVLGEEMSDATARFLTWRIPTMKSRDRWLFALGLVIVATRFRNGRITDRHLGDAATWFLAEEAAAKKELRPGINPADPPPAAFGLTYGLWKPLLTELLENASTVESTDVRKELEFIGAIIRAES